MDAAYEEYMTSYDFMTPVALADDFEQLGSAC